MSIVAVRIYDDRIEVAADSIMVRGWTQTNKYSKLHFINDMYDKYRKSERRLWKSSGFLPAQV